MIADKPTNMLKELMKRLEEEQREGGGELSRLTPGVRLPFLVDVLNLSEKIGLPLDQAHEKQLNVNVHL